MKYCRNKILDRAIKDMNTRINYWEHRDSDKWSSRYIVAYKNAVRRIEKLKNKIDKKNRKDIARTE